jgi:RNA methyltransferase, TrmH family
MQLVDQFNKARKSSFNCVLEGFHPIKHALRFGGKIDIIYVHDLDKLNTLVLNYCPDLKQEFTSRIREISPDVFNKLSKNPPKTGAIAIARKPKYELEKILNMKSKIIFLENIRSLDNLGAIIRVGAARGVAGVLMSGTIDPFHSTCLRASRGLHFAIPVVKVSGLPKINKVIVAFDENGVDFNSVKIPSNSLLVFGSERGGVSQELKDFADIVLSIPMQSGVSSLNLATSVAIGLYKK